MYVCVCVGVYMCVYMSVNMSTALSSIACIFLQVNRRAEIFRASSTNEHQITRKAVMSASSGAKTSVCTCFYVQAAY